MNPNELGAPERFKSWRPGQDRAFQHLIDSARRFDVLALPTGVGKSLLGVLYAKLLGQRAVILTSTKGLMDQYLELFSETLAELRGMNNYVCVLEEEKWTGQKRKTTVDEGPCWDGEECVYQDRGCHYFDAWRKAEKAQIVVTNYAMWFAMLASERNLGPRDVLVCDEAHDAPAQVAAAVGCELKEDELQIPTPQEYEGWAITNEWKLWAGAKSEEVRIALEGARKGWERRRLRELGRKLLRLRQAAGDWLMSETQEPGGMGGQGGRGGRVVTFEPIWAAPYAEGMLFRGIEKVILLSATITPKTLEYLGVKERDRYFLEVPSPFPVSHRPVYHLPTVKLDRNSTESELRIWANRIDQIIRGRLDRKGIVHTVSYARAKALKKMSEHSRIMIVPRSGGETKAAVEEFRRAPAPSVLVSPSVHTGYDFPDDVARYQVIGKMPFPDNRDPITAARTKADRDYLLWVAITTMVQMTGRVVRGEEDWGETLIVDDMVNQPWVLKRNAHMFPKWWLDSYRSVGVVPRAPELGEMGGDGEMGETETGGNRR